MILLLFAYIKNESDEKGGFQMDEKDCIILQTIYEERNITKASERLYTSQPALSYRIRELEKNFKVKLLLRGKKGVMFTAEGEYLVQYANRVLKDLRKTKEHLENMDKKISGTLRLCVSSVFARYELPAILSEFRQMYPDIEIVLRTGWSSRINQMMQKEEAHVGIIRGNYEWKDKKYLIDNEKIYIVSKDKINLNELPKLSRINYETDSSLKIVLDNWWQENFDAPPNVTMEVDRMETCREMVLHGLGYALMPGICIKGFANLHTFELPSKDNKDYSRKTWLIYHDNSLELSFVNVFIKLMKERTINIQL